MSTARRALWRAVVYLVVLSMLFSATFFIYPSPVFAQTEPPPDTGQGEAGTLEDPTEAEVGQEEPQTGALLDRAAQDGQVGVIVVLKVTDVPGTGQPAGAFAGVQDAFTRSMARQNMQNIHRYQNFPLVAARVDAVALRALLNNPLVDAVQEDSVNYPTLLESTTIIGATEAVQAGYNGAGVTLAVIDTGVEKTHGFLAGRVVAEACYSTGGGQANSLCPNGLSEQTGSGAGVACNISGCDHGTHVAGIAAGAGNSYSGVARQANIIAINVFSYSPIYGLVTYDSDYIKGLDFVYSLRATYTIAAANMSLGGGQFTRYCNVVKAATKRAIDRLRTANIATVIASGNNGFTSSMSSPACVSTAVSVGSTNKDDTVSDFSNYASFLSLLAPGGEINSSVTGGGYGAKSGTSMATPHVTGAWAVLRQAFPTKNVAAILALLKTTGVPVRDSRNNKVKPRINLAYALGKFQKPLVAPTLVSPADGASLNNSTPLLVWSRLPLVSKYKVVVKRNGVTTVFSKLFAASAVCPLAGGDCSAQVPTILRTAMHTWTVQPFSGAGGGPVSLARSFYTPNVVPGAIQLTFPIAGIGFYSPDFRWSEVGNPTAALYTLRVYFNGRRILNKTYPALNICAGGLCSVPRPLTLKEGDYSWEVLPSNPVGYGATQIASFDFHVANGYDNHFDTDRIGVTPLYPQPSWWWLENSNLMTEYGKNYTFASARIDALYTDVDASAVMYRDGDPVSSNGIILRGVPTLVGSSKDWRSGYFFLYANDGYFSIFKVYNNREYILQDWTFSPAVNQGGTNTLRAVASGTGLSFYINTTLVWSGTDTASGPDLTNGATGVVSYVEDWFDNFDYLAVDRVTTVVPNDPNALEAETVSAEQQALNDAANDNPAGSIYGHNRSAEEIRFLQSAPDQPEATLEEKLQACRAAGVCGQPLAE